MILPEVMCASIALMSYFYMPASNSTIRFLSKKSYELFLVHFIFLFAADLLHTQIELPFFVWTIAILGLSILTAWGYHEVCYRLYKLIIKK